MFYFLKLLLTLGLFFLILSNLIKNIDYYSYCKLSEYKKGLFIRNEYSREFQMLCKDIFKDFSDHIFLRYSFNYVYQIIKPEDIFKYMGEKDANKIIEKIEHTYLGSLKYNLKFFKFTNFLFYMVNLYIIFIILPEFLTKFLIFVMNKCLFLLFLFFAIEGFLNFYTNIRINSVNIISTFIEYIPFTMIKNIFEYSKGIIIYLREYLKI